MRATLFKGRLIFKNGQNFVSLSPNYLFKKGKKLSDLIDYAKHNLRAKELQQQANGRHLPG
jgi:hypothetical protein